MPRFLDQLRQVINDPAIEVVRAPGPSRPGAPPSRLNPEAFEVIEAAIKHPYGVITLPTMSTGATDMAYLRGKGIQSFGVGPMIDRKDGPNVFGGHDDQERILEEALNEFVRFHWDVVLELAAKKQ